jgi:CheY-like chemotaxis protein
LVDDEPLWREVVYRRLTLAGYQVNCAPNGRVALDVLADGAPDLIVTDVRMPVMDGYDLCAAVRRDPALAKVPIIIMTARDEPGLRRVATEFAVFRYLIKPVPGEAVVTTVAAALAGGLGSPHAPAQRPF